MPINTFEQSLTQRWLMFYDGGTKIERPNRLSRTLVCPNRTQRVNRI